MSPNKDEMSISISMEMDDETIFTNILNILLLQRLKTFLLSDVLLIVVGLGNYRQHYLPYR